MGLLMSDTMLIDPTLNETMRLLDSLADWAYSPDAGRETDDREDADLSA
jgi:hypothetical protein